MNGPGRMDVGLPALAFDLGRHLAAEGLIGRNGLTYHASSIAVDIGAHSNV